MIKYKYMVGELVMYKHTQNAFPPKHGIIVERQHDLYIRYKVQWYDGGFNFFLEEDVSLMRNNVDRWLKDDKAQGW